MTNNDILLLKQSIDVAIAQLSGQLPNLQDEVQRGQARQIINDYIQLSAKVGLIEVDKKENNV